MKRILLDTLESQLEEHSLREDSRFALFLTAPTAYGKSTLTRRLAVRLLKNWGAFGERLIHTLPMRSIIDQQYKDAMNELKRQLSIGAQAMQLLDVEKSPFFLHDLVYTTLDSFTMNLFKVPVAEAMHQRSHFEVSRYAIYSSFVVFDEAHLFASESGEAATSNRRMHTAFATCLNVLSEAAVPLLTMSATIPESLLNFLLDKIDDKAKKFALVFDAGKKDDHGRIKYMSDDDYVGEKQNVTISTKVIRDMDFLVELQKCTDIAPRILIVRNTIKKAHQSFLSAKELLQPLGYSVQLLHSRFTASDRSNKLTEIIEKSKAEGRICLTSTQVIEAGMNIDFDVLFSDAAPFAQLVQRVGRVCRFTNGKKREGFVYIIDGEGDGIYDKTLTKNSVESIKAYNSNLQWKIPDSGNKANYMRILNDIYRKIDFHDFFDGAFAGALHDIDKIVTLEQRMIREFLKRVCSFVRDDLLVSVVLPLWNTASFSSFGDLWAKALIPVEAGILARAKFIDITSDGILMCALVEDNQLKEFTSEVFAHALDRPCWLAKAMQELHKEARRKLDTEHAIVLGPVVKADAYSSEEGLLLA